MKTKQRAALSVDQRRARDRTEAYHDARALALELARGEPLTRFDPMTAGVVLRPGERFYRQVPLWIRVQEEGCWAEASFADVIVTDLHLLCRTASGRLTSLWWNGVVGLRVDLAAEHIVLDFGDGQPVYISGPAVGAVAVVGIVSLYGLEALLGHPSLALLRSYEPERGQT